MCLIGFGAKIEQDSSPLGLDTPGLNDEWDSLQSFGLKVASSILLYSVAVFIINAY